MSAVAIGEMLKGAHFEHCLELGPGAGTWTRMLHEKEPEARLTLLDISETMLNMARRNLESISPQIEFIVQDFTSFKPVKKYDLFFSSRAFEYIENKNVAVRNISEALINGGEGILITKYPRYWADALLGREVPKMHQGQISPSKLTALLGDVGIEVRSLRPATVTVPLFKSSRLNDIAYKLLRHFWFTPVHMFFTESYIIHFKSQ
jgi:trans-aconitate methyltransferase